MPGKDQFFEIQQHANSGGFRLDSVRFGTLRALGVQLRRRRRGSFDSRWRDLRHRLYFVR